MRSIGFVVACFVCACSGAQRESAGSRATQKSFANATTIPTAAATTITPTPTPTATPTSTESSPTESPRDSVQAPAAEPRPLKTYASVLSVGDSFNGAFSLALEKRFRAEGTSFARDVWVAVALQSFAKDARFANLLAKHDPDLVIVNLGANDVDWTDPEPQAKHVRAIVETIGAHRDRARARDGTRTLDCYWVAPALWKKDNGIVDVIAKNVAPCRFFDSKGFKVERRGDGWHPSVEGGALWAERFWTFFKGDGAIR